MIVDGNHIIRHYTHETNSQIQMGKGKALECGRGGSLPLVRSHGSRAALLTFRKFSYCSHSVVHNFYCCSVVTTVNNKNSVQRPTFTTLSRTLPGGCGRGTVVTVRDLRSGARSGRFGPGRARLCAVSAVALRLGSRSAGRALSRSGGGDLSHAGT